MDETQDMDVPQNAEVPQNVDVICVSSASSDKSGSPEASGQGASSQSLRAQMQPQSSSPAPSLSPASWAAQSNVSRTPGHSILPLLHIDQSFRRILHEHIEQVNKSNDDMMTSVVQAIEQMKATQRQANESLLNRIDQMIGSD